MYTALEDIKLQTVDFKWINQTTKISHLKRAIRLIELDGDYFKQLKDACYERIGQIDPSQKRIVIDNRMTSQMQNQINKQLQEWQLNLQKKTNPQELMINKHQKQQNQQKQQQQQINYEQYFTNNQSQSQNKQKLADNQRIKGNQAIRSRDYEEAIKYYTKSVGLDGKMHQSYGNRALAYIKMKQFQKALNDCNQAIKINPQYVKAYHRKAKALIGIKNRVQAYRTFQEALKIQPQNSQINNELKELREEMNQQELKQLEGNSQFKKIVIQEDSDQDQEEEIVQK